ncbi:aminoglycoside phosphotransferase family protein [Spirillospora sp. NPDC048911]|uniref:aminoglycoside phosphotransferase family protein n=1 Tax=Spirillospora sp. NPDC048911 TaxID=3364527 RepID=UPI00370FD9F7
MTLHRVRVPREVAEGVSARWPSVGTVWHGQVLSELAALCQRYKVTPVHTFDARYSLVVETARGDGTRLVMRSTPDPLGIFQAEVSQSLAKVGAGPQVHEVLQTAIGVWTVADRISPGDSLYYRPGSIESLAATLNLLQGQAAPIPEMPTLGDWLRGRLSDENPIDIPPGRSPASPQERQRALALLASLESTTSNNLCHGDASSNNVLHSDSKLQLIDPRGISGELAYDVAVAAWKTASDEESLVRRALTLAKLVGVELQRVEAWLTIATAARV